mgnify:FL=1
MRGFLFYRPAVSEDSGGQREGRLKIRQGIFSRSVFRRPMYWKTDYRAFSNFLRSNTSRGSKFFKKRASSDNAPS